MTLKTLWRRSETSALPAAAAEKGGLHQAAMRLRDGMLFAAAAVAVFRFFGGDFLSPRDAIAAVNRRVDTLHEQVHVNTVVVRDNDERTKFLVSTVCAMADDQHATTAQHLCTQLEQQRDPSPLASTASASSASMATMAVQP